MITGTTCDMIVYIYGSSTTYPHRQTKGHNKISTPSSCENLLQIITIYDIVSLLHSFLPFLSQKFVIKMEFITGRHFKVRYISFNKFK
jgi:hypothetical protein